MTTRDLIIDMKRARNAILNAQFMHAADILRTAIAKAEADESDKPKAEAFSEWLDQNNDSI